MFQSKEIHTESIMNPNTHHCIPRGAHLIDPLGALSAAVQIHVLNSTREDLGAEASQGNSQLCKLYYYTYVIRISYIYVYIYIYKHISFIPDNYTCVYIYMYMDSCIFLF